MAYSFFIDTNVLYDHYGNRQPFSNVVSPMLFVTLKNKHQLYTASACVTTCLYLLNNTDKISIENQKTILRDLSNIFNFVEADNQVYLKTAKSNYSDLEDGILYYTADQASIDYLVTRNIKDFKQEGFTQIISPEEALKLAQTQD